MIKLGTRNATLFRHGRSLRARGRTFETLAAELRQVNRERCDPPCGDREITDMIRHVWTYRDAEGWTRTQHQAGPEGAPAAG